MLATGHVFLVTAVVFVLGAGAVWIAPKPKPMAEPMVEH
jgi:hypothetical protein